jgi:N-acetylglucosamine-6-phosphate deacetylase
MTPTTLYPATVLTPTEVIERGAVVVSDEGRVAYVGPEDGAPSVEGERLDVRGRIVAPGFVDVHVHGGKGVTFGQAEEGLREDLGRYARWVPSTGVTGFVASVAAPDPDALLALVGAYAAILEGGEVGGARPLGLHLEGPFLNAAQKGAFNPRWLRPPALEEARALLEAGGGWIRQMTLAPELPGAGAVAALCRQAGVVASLGHTDAGYEVAREALAGDFTHVTHTFNAQRGFHHRDPGVLGAILTSKGVTAELIADAVHVHPGAMELLLRCLGVRRVVLVTDAMAAAGLRDGEYRLVGHGITVRDGKATLADGTLAGSTTTLDRCVRNAHLKVGVPLPEAVSMASLIPARAMGLCGELGSLQPGKRADLVVIDEGGNVYLTMVGGEIVYESL